MLRNLLLFLLVIHTYCQDTLKISDTLITEREAILSCSSSVKSDFHFEAIVSVPDLDYYDTISYYYRKTIILDTTISEKFIVESDTIFALHLTLPEHSSMHISDFRKGETYYFLNSSYSGNTKELKDTLAYNFEYSGSWGQRGHEPSGNCSFTLEVPIDSTIVLQHDGFLIKAGYNRLLK